MNAMARICFALVATSWIAAAGVASAAPVYDDAYTIINLVNEVRINSGKKSATVTYSPQVKLRLFGVESGDAVKVKFKKGKKVLFEKRCPLNVRGGAGDIATSERCWTRDAGLTAHGRLTADVLWVDDSEEKETLIRTLKFEVGRFWQLDRVIKRKPVYSPRYQVVGADMMGLSYAWMREPSNTEAFGRVYFYFWSTLANDNSNYSDPSWRCKKDGVSVPEMNVDGHRVIESIADMRVDEGRLVGRQRKSIHYAWRQMWVKPMLIWGKTRNPNASKLISNSNYNISQHPGSYVCRLRNEGETVREFAFAVQDDGLIAQHGAVGPGGLTLRPGAYFTGIKIVRNKAESSFDAKAAKKSVAFGRKWTKTADVKAMLKAFPKSFGTTIPKPPRGKR